MSTNSTRTKRLTEIPEEDRLDTLDNAELRYNVHVRWELGDKLKTYFRLKATAAVLANFIKTTTHPWRHELSIQGDIYEVAYRNCNYDYICENNELSDDSEFLLSVRNAKDGRTKIVLIVPWNSPAARHSITGDIPWYEG